MTDYSREFGSRFPSELIHLNAHKDIDDSVVNLISQYTSYMDSGQTDLADQLYELNKDTLEPYCVTMQYINYLKEEIYNTGLLALSTSDVIHSEEEPVMAGQDAYWIREYK